jgi:hypothetical protein
MNNPVVHNTVDGRTLTDRYDSTGETNLLCIIVSEWRFCNSCLCNHVYVYESKNLFIYLCIIINRCANVIICIFTYIHRVHNTVNGRLPTDR